VIVADLMPELKLRPLNGGREAGEFSVEVKSDTAGFVLAGGESSRMGRDKALLEFDGVPLVVRTVRLVEAAAGSAAVVASPKTYGALGLRVIADDWPGAGPLGGIATALRASQFSWNLIVACDLPYLSEEWLKHLVSRALSTRADAVVPMSERGAEPLCAMYHKNCEAAIRGALGRGMRKVTEALQGVCIDSIEPGEWKAFDSDGMLFKNMNSPADYEEAVVRLSGEAKPSKP
jgi:molybdenum cofactor guanylyltransferase